MKSSRRGKNISKVELQAATPRGLWILVKGVEYFLPYVEFPWFKDAAIRDLELVELVHDSHLHWPSLDIDLALESLSNREKYPLVSRMRATHKRSPLAA
jgi:hypothetical protein